MYDDQASRQFAPPHGPTSPQQAPGQSQFADQPLFGARQSSPEAHGAASQRPTPYGQTGQQRPVQLFQPARRNGMYIAGIILTVFGGIGVLGQLSAAGAGTNDFDPSVGPYYVVTYFALLILSPVSLVAGIIMIVRSKRRPV